MRHALLSLMLLFAAPAFAADTITVQIVSDVPGASGTLTGTITFTQADMGTFLQALEASTGTVTPTAAATSWFQSLKAEFIRLGVAYQNQQALSTVVPINPN